MRKSFIFGISAFIIGLVLLAFGLGHNGLHTVYWRHGIKVDGQVRETKQIKNVQEIDLEMAQSVLIRRGSQAKVSVKSTKSARVELKYSDKKLTVTSHREPVMMFGGEDSSQNQVEITIPKRAQLKTVTMGGDSDLTVEDLDLERLDMENSYRSGSLTLKQVKLATPLEFTQASYADMALDRVTAPGLTIDTSGNLTITHSQFEEQNSTIVNSSDDVDLSYNSWRAVDLKMDNGDLSFRQEKVKKIFVANLMTGDIDGQVEQNGKNVILANSKYGDISLYGQKRKTSGKRNAKNAVIYRLSNNDGDIDITY